MIWELISGQTSGVDVAFVDVLLWRCVELVLVLTIS
jgi:hypothetical protein